MFELYKESHAARLEIIDNLIDDARNRDAGFEELFYLSRLKGLGGSDMAPMLGRSPWKTSYGLWREKSDLQYKEIPFDKAIPLMYGHFNEKFVVDLYRKKTGLDAREHETVASPSHPFLIANFDRVVYNGNSAVGILECKTTAYNNSITLPDGTERPKWGKPNYEKDAPDAANEDIDPIYYPQVQFYLGISGLRWCDVAVLIGNSDFRVYRVRPNPKYIAAMFARAEEFWCKNVLEGIPPERTIDDLKTSGDLDPDPLEANEALIDTVYAANEAGKRYRAAKEEYDKYRNLIAQSLGDHEKAVYRDAGGKLKTLATFRSSKRASFDTESFKHDHPDLYEKYVKEIVTSRTLRIY